MQHWEQIHCETVDGFEIVLSVTPDDTHPRDSFDDSCCNVDEVCQDIDDGRLVWFTARVEARKGHIVFGTDYLGGCLYRDAKEFISDDYFQDMKLAAITEAKEAIQTLTA